VLLGEEIPLELGHQSGVLGTPLRNHYFTAVSSFSMKTVADRHRLVAYHKHCLQASWGYQHLWLWTTL